ncbi:MAG: HAD-IA family hydrolase [Gammaproteobacteria bacterium]
MSHLPEARTAPVLEVSKNAERRQFNAKYKLRILQELSRSAEPGQVGALLRREGLYSSHLSKWRAQREAGLLPSLAPSTARLEAIILDLDGTLYRTTALRALMTLRLLGSYSWRPFEGMRVARILSSYRRAQEMLRRLPPGDGDLAERQVTLAAQRCRAEPAIVASHVTRWMEREPLALLPRCMHPGLLRFLSAAVERGLRLAVLSDYPAEAKLEAMGIRRFFHFLVCAQDPNVQRFKPDPRGLQVALERLGVSEDQALYVGDRVDLDAPTAANAGVACAIIGSAVPPAPGAWSRVSGFEELWHVVAGRSALETPRACWICGSRNVVHWKDRNIERRLEPADFRITDHRYGTTLSLARCRDCGFIFSDDEEVRDLTAFYEALDDPEYEETQDTRLRQMRWLLSSTLALKPGARTLLDVGAGTGLLVAEARRRSLDAVGIEPSRKLVELGRRMNDAPLILGVLPHPELSSRRFDVVLLVDVIEHVSDPVALLRQAAALLSPGGVLVLVTPDAGSIAARLLGRRWWHFRLAHVGYFSARSLERLVENSGLVILERHRAKWFFPVAYLAERLSVYLPLGWLNPRAARSSALRWLYSRVIPLDLHDSYVLYLGTSHG